MLTELRLAARRLMADPWAAFGAVLVAALGTGLNSAVFAVAYGVLGRPLPYADAGRLAIVDGVVRRERIDEWRARLGSFERVGAYATAGFTVIGAGDPRSSPVAVVDADFFQTLGAGPRAGRPFSRGETGGVVVSDWLSADAPLGARLTIGDVPLIVVGIMPAAFAFPSAGVDVWMPVAVAPGIAFDWSADARRFHLVGRLRPGVSIAQAADEASRTRQALDPESSREVARVRVESLNEMLVAPARPVLLAFAAAGAIVLLIACANVATILIGRTVSRRRELAVRRALGASPVRLMTGVVSESVLVTGAGSIAGMLLAVLAVRLVARWAAGILPRLSELAVDWRVLLFAVASAAAASALAALPALRAVGGGAEQLREGGPTMRAGSRRLRGTLVVTQIALAVTLLSGGGLLARTILGLLHAGVGLDTRGAAVSQLMLTRSMSFAAADRGPMLDELLRRVRAIPGVTDAGAGSSLPPDNAGIEMRVTFEENGVRTSHFLTEAGATPGYLPALGARILQGRDFEEADDGLARPVVVLSESAARVLMPPGDVVGRELPVSLPGLRGRGHPAVIGVVSDVKYLGLEAQAGPTVYLRWRDLPAGQSYLAVRSSSGAAAIAPQLRAVLRAIDPRLPLMPVRSLDEVVERSVADRRLRALLGGAVALLAFAVAMVGLAGSLTRVVSERRRELAIRAALGATPARTVRAILGEGTVLVAAGIAIGLGGALAAGRALRALLQGVAPHDPATLGGVAMLVAVVSLVACYLPARRAARVDPLALLRAE